MAPDGNLAVVERYLVRPGQAERFEAHLARLEQLATPAAGWVALDIVAPLDEACPEYLVVHRVSPTAWRAAARAEPWRRWRREAGALAEAVRAEAGARHGMAAWLAPRPSAGPVRWRMTVLSTLVIWPLVLLLERVLDPVVGDLPPWAAGLVVTAALSALLTYVVLPRATRLLAGWLHPVPPPARSPQQGSRS